MAQHWPHLEFRGRLAGYRYCFTEEFSGGMVSIFKHLVIQHRRKAKKHGEKVLSLRAFWCYSFFPEFRWKNVPPELSHCGELAKLEDRSLDQFFSHLSMLETAYDDNLEEGLDRHGEARALLRELSRGREPSSHYSLELVEHCRSLLARTKKMGKVEFKQREEPSEKIAAFLSTLRTEGEAQQSGQFSVEASRARQKLADFQLQNRQEFVLYFIAGAIAGGCSDVRVYVDSDDIIVQFQGSAIGQLELEQLFSQLVSGTATLQGKFLAVGFQAAASLKPKSLYLESWHGESGLRLDVRTSDQEISPLESSPFEMGGEGHRIHFRDQMSLNIVRRFLKSLSTSHPEADMVRLRCAHAPVPILLPSDGDCRSYPDCLEYWLLEHPDNPVDISFLGESAVGTRAASPGDVSILLLFGPDTKVICQVLGLNFSPPVATKLGFWALVVDNNAKLDLSFSCLVDGDRWKATSDVLAEAASAFRRHLGETYPELEKEEQWRRSFAMQRAAAEGFHEFQDLAIHGELNGELFSRTELRQQDKIRYTTKDWEYGPRDGRTVFRLDRAATHYLPSKLLEEYDSHLERSQTYFEKRSTWLEQEPQDLLDGLGVVPIFELKGFPGYLAPAKRAQRKGVCRFFSQKRPLLEREFRLAKGVIAILNHPELAMTDDWSDLLENEVYARSQAALERELDSFFRFLAQGGSAYVAHCLHYLIGLEKRGIDWPRRGWADLPFLGRKEQKLTLRELANDPAKRSLNLSMFELMLVAQLGDAFPQNK